MIVYSLETKFSLDQMKMIDDAVHLGDRVRADLGFVSGISAMREPMLMERLVKEEILHLRLAFYKPWNPFTSACAYAQDGVIYLNPKAFKRGVEELLETLFHEVTHCPPLNYTHGFWWTPWRKSSVPYAVGTLALRVARGLNGKA